MRLLEVLFTYHDVVIPLVLSVTRFNHCMSFLPITFVTMRAHHHHHTPTNATLIFTNNYFSLFHTHPSCCSSQLCRSFKKKASSSLQFYKHSLRNPKAFINRFCSTQKCRSQYHQCGQRHLHDVLGVGVKVDGIELLWAIQIIALKTAEARRGRGVLMSHAIRGLLFQA